MASRQRRWILSGGIGSGKSEVRRLLEDLGVRTIDADLVGHEVLAHEALEAVAGRWPQVIKDGMVDRRSLARIVFDDLEELRELEGITHPLIFGRIEANLQGYEGPAVVEMPVVRNMDRWSTIVVDAWDDDRIERALGRGMDREDVMRRVISQPTRAEWLAIADLVIPNHGSTNELRQTVSDALLTVTDPVIY